MNSHGPFLEINGIQYDMNTIKHALGIDDAHSIAFCVDIPDGQIRAEPDLNNLNIKIAQPASTAIPAFKIASINQDQDPENPEAAPTAPTVYLYNRSKTAIAHMHADMRDMESIHAYPSPSIVSITSNKADKVKIYADTNNYELLDHPDPFS